MLNTVIGEEKYGYSQNTTYKQLLENGCWDSLEDKKAITAKRFNIMRYCIGSMNPTGLVDKIQGDVIFGDYFIILTDALNGIE